MTNDDGFDAPGLALLAELAQEFAQEVWMVAPAYDQSGTGQSLSLHDPVRCAERGERRWAVEGTPADCVAVAINHFMADARPSLVLSGINSGGNLGDDLNMSGTAGAAFMALMLGVPAIGISQDYSISREETPWETSRVVVPKVLRHLLAEGWRKETCLSVNIPDAPPEAIKGFSWARQGQKNVSGVTVEKRVSPRSGDYFWLQIERKPSPVVAPNSDYAVLKRNDVAVTVLGLDRSVECAKPSVRFDEPDGESSVESPTLSDV